MSDNSTFIFDNYPDPFLPTGKQINRTKGKFMRLARPATPERIGRLAAAAVQSDSQEDADELLSTIRAVSHSLFRDEERRPLPFSIPRSLLSLASSFLFSPPVGPPHYLLTSLDLSRSLVMPLTRSRTGFRRVRIHEST